jgi:hypothetical protein
MNFRYFYFKISQNFKNFNFNCSVFSESIKPDQIGFHENGSVFIGKQIHGLMLSHLMQTKFVHVCNITSCMYM